MSLFRKKVSVGLDFGSHSLQWAGTDSKGRDCEVWRELIHPKRRSKDDYLLGDTYKERLRSLLTRAERECKLWSKTVVVGVQGQNVVCGYLELPQLKDDELELAVLSNVSREVPFPVDSLEIVHLPVPPLQAGKKAVFYSVWKKAMGQRLRHLCDYCDLKVRRIEATGIGLTRELFQNRALDPKRFYAIVNIGFELTQIVLVRGGYPYYLRDIPVGGRDITYAVQVGSQVSWEEAEEIKCSHPLYELVHTAGPLLGELSYELSRSVAYFRRRFQVEDVEAVYLSGGGSLLKDFPDWLEEELKMPVRCEGWKQIQARTPDSNNALHSVSVGLALGQ
jgi:type IV pilus assembly protein PilM